MLFCLAGSLHSLQSAAPRRCALLIALLSVSCMLPRSAAADAKTALPAASGTLKMEGPVQTYTPGTLENLIDGEAEAIKRYDFKQCAHAAYAPGGTGNQLMTVDVFQMGAPLDAYGLYTGQRNASAPVIKVGAEGYQEKTALNFWKGPYYVRIAITATNAVPFQPEMPKLAQMIAAKLEGPITPPPIAQVLPPGYKPRSESFRRADIFGQIYLRNGMIADYATVGPQARLAVCQFATPADAKKAYTQYHDYLSKPTTAAVGAKAEEIKGLGQSAVGVKTKFTGQVVAALSGRYLVAVQKAKDPASAQALAKAAIGRAK